MQFRSTRKTLCVLVVMLLVSTTAVAKDVDDAAITRTVKKKIAYDDTVRLDDLETITSDGVVTLVGSVDNLLAKLQATRIAENVRGVRAVVPLFGEPGQLNLLRAGTRGEHGPGFQHESMARWKLLARRGAAVEVSNAQ